MYTAERCERTCLETGSQRFTCTKQARHTCIARELLKITVMLMLTTWLFIGQRRAKIKTGEASSSESRPVYDRSHRHVHGGRAAHDRVDTVCGGSHVSHRTDRPQQWCVASRAFLAWAGPGLGGRSARTRAMRTVANRLDLFGVVNEAVWKRGRKQVGHACARFRTSSSVDG